MEIDKRTAMNILKSRTIIGLGVTKNVQVTNVSFANTDGTPFAWEEGSSSAGEPYAIANFNAINAYGKAQAQVHFANGDYQEACNTNLSARVSLEKGRQLQEAMYASVVGEKRTIELKDPESGELTGDTAETILVNKCFPNMAKDASESKAEFDFGEEADMAGAPTADRQTATN